MKNIFEKTKTFIKENKAKTAITLACAILLVPLLVYGIIKTIPEDTASTANSGKEVTAVADVKTDKKKETSQSDSSTTSTVNKLSSKDSAAKTPSKSNTSSNSSSSSSSTTAPKKKEWVVDRKAYDETKSVPVYEDVDVYNLYATNRETGVEELLGKYYTYADTFAAMEAIDNNKYVNVAYELNYETKLVRTDTQVIHHPEEGHWEYK
ncbi:hypothetical protein SAMN02910327_00743 [Peptostreptococcaceae bacterium pGA-8]|nr:hypothetical protein SAMN02910327_00743 [Peptostreptococcaceae bacterium pGA-8]